MRRNHAKRDAAKKVAVASSERVCKTKPVDRFGSEDLIKHYVRRSYWLKRAQKLKRDLGLNVLRYFTLCGRMATDILYFRQNGIISNTGQDVAYCEILKDDYDFLSKWFPTYVGFWGRLEEIATRPGNSDFGRFWQQFPFDVLNLDFYGDIHQDFNVGVHELIDDIIRTQAKSRRQFEFWVTMRAKQTRISPAFFGDYRKIIEHNATNIISFKEEATKVFMFKNRDLIRPGIQDVVRTGFAKWLRYIAKTHYCCVNEDESELVHYDRTDRDGKLYKIFKFMLRIVPYDRSEIPSPASDGCRMSEERYEQSVRKCLSEGINLDRIFSGIDPQERLTLSTEVRELEKKYYKEEKNQSGFHL